MTLLIWFISLDPGLQPVALELHVALQPLCNSSKYRSIFLMIKIQLDCNTSDHYHMQIEDREGLFYKIQGYTVLTPHTTFQLACLQKKNMSNMSHAIVFLIVLLL